MIAEVKDETRFGRSNPRKWGMGGMGGGGKRRNGYHERIIKKGFFQEVQPLTFFQGKKNIRKLRRGNDQINKNISNGE